MSGDFGIWNVQCRPCFPFLIGHRSVIAYINWLTMTIYFWDSTTSRRRFAPIYGRNNQLYYNSTARKATICVVFRCLLSCTVRTKQVFLPEHMKNNQVMSKSTIVLFVAKCRKMAANVPRRVSQSMAKTCTHSPRPPKRHSRSHKWPLH